ncbi:MAG: hypothetical protein Q9162_004680 [Coniocarpon cinnabarinum]
MNKKVIRVLTHKNSQFGPFVQTFSFAAAAGSKVLGILDHPVPSIDVYAQDGLTCQNADFDHDIVLQDVSFRYPARITTRVLHDVTLRIKPGRTTGIVGLSGSGKSTIAGLLLRLYDPFSGKVYLGGRDLSQFNLSTLRARISFVDQNPTLFTGTILQNIQYGIISASQYTDEEVLGRCKRAALAANADFIATLPKGIHTKVGMSGDTSLSGGQKQRICLARALVSEPKLLILDEPTSALDSLSESLITESLKRVAASGCTIVMIAHRMATVQDLDTIVVLEKGALIEQGSHEELLEHNGVYKELVLAQQLPSPGELTQSLPEQMSPSDSSISTIDQFEKHAQRSLPLVDHLQAKDSGALPLRTVLLRCFVLSKPERSLLLIGLVASVFAGAVVIGESICFGHLINLLNADDVSGANVRSQVDFYCLMFFAISFVALLAYSLSGAMFGLVSEALILRVRDISLRTILKQDISWFATPGHSAHELMASVNTNSGQLAGLSGVILGTLFSVVTSVVGGLILALIVAWKIAVVLLSAVPVMIIAGFLRLRVLAKSEEKHETIYSSAAAQASEAFQKMRTVATLGREAGVLSEYKIAVADCYTESFKFIIFGNLTLAFSLAITYFVYALAYWWGARQVRDGNYSQLDFFIVLPALLFAAQSSGQMFSFAPEWTKARSAANNILKLHDQRPTILVEQDNDPRGHMLGRVSTNELTSISDSVLPSEPDQVEKVIPLPKGRLELEDVVFAYPSRPQECVLNRVSMTIEPNQFVGIVGSSGAGKSSLVGLLERFFDAQSGTIRFDGVDIRSRPASKHRERLSLVSQEPDLFSGSIAFNIRLGGRPGQSVTQDDIENVCRECGIHDFIMALPEGYSTQVGFNGSKLSGGQKQRVAVARALVRNPDVLLLDEATASLDSQSEKQVHQATLAAAKNRTTIVIAHRLTTVQHADNIFVFDKGRIVERGRHEELIAKRGVYASMVQAQSLTS